MVKRFTDTEIWNEDWFLELAPEYMVFWRFLIDSCDHSGIWKPNKTRFEKLTGFKIDLNKAIDVINSGKERIKILPNERWFLTGFIPFQYGKQLNMNNRVHASVYWSLIDNDVNLTSIRPQIEVTQGVKDKEKDKDKDFKDSKDSKDSKDFKDFKERFDKIWERYPRRDGRTEAKRHFMVTVKNNADWESIKWALENYKEYIKKEKVESKYIKMGSTWFNNWQDWKERPDGENQYNKNTDTKRF